jgi:hypothetical protein
VRKSQALSSFATSEAERIGSHADSAVTHAPPSLMQRRHSCSAVIHAPPSLRAQRSNPAFVRRDADDPGEPQRWIASLRSQ